MAKGAALDLIRAVTAQWLPWLEGLERCGLEEAWRANILHVEQFASVVQDNVVELSFTLPAGSYATVVLRELVLY